jgi:hypothetical protein
MMWVEFAVVNVILSIVFFVVADRTMGSPSATNTVSAAVIVYWITFFVRRRGRKKRELAAKQNQPKAQ